MAGKSAHTSNRDDRSLKRTVKKSRFKNTGNEATDG